jgi:hypothetical protein
MRPNIIWRPPAVDRANSCIIYHVNGYLPQNKGASRSDNIVLTEDSFAALLASPNLVETEYVMNRFVANTMLVIGASFQDPSLRNLFYATARRNPSGFHYILQHDADISEVNIGADERQDRADLNKEMYNIITYFVNKTEISSVVKMLALEDNEFNQRLNELSTEAGVETTYRYYVVGTVSAGKSSLIERLRGFKTYEEWTEPPLESMFRDHDTLSNQEREQIDEWVLRQLALKDDTLRRARYGIHVMDRAPLDMFAFSKTAFENQEKAKKLKGRIGQPGVQEGQLIFLEAHPNVLVERQLRRGRSAEWLEDKAYREESLKIQNLNLKQIYSPYVSSVDTSSMSMEEVAREVAEQMLFGNYAPADLESCRKRFEGGEDLK